MNNSDIPDLVGESRVSSENSSDRNAEERAGVEGDMYTLKFVVDSAHRVDPPAENISEEELAKDAIYKVLDVNNGKWFYAKIHQIDKGIKLVDLSIWPKYSPSDIRTITALTYYPLRFYPLEFNLDRFERYEYFVDPPSPGRQGGGRRKRRNTRRQRSKNLRKRRNTRKH